MEEPVFLHFQPLSDPTLTGARIDHRRYRHIFQRQSQIARHGSFFRALPSRLLACDQFTKLGMSRWNVLEVTDLPIVLKLRNIIGTKLVDLAQRIGVPVGIEIYQRGKRPSR